MCSFFKKTLQTVLLTIAAGLSCQETPVAPEGNMNSNTIVLADVVPAFDGKEETISSAVTDALALASESLLISDVRIEVSFDSQGAIPGFGVGGYTPNKSLIQIALDPAYSDNPDLLSARLPLVVLHELHHAVRWKNPGYGSTLLEAMVSEGLADHFAIAVLGVSPPPWSAALTQNQKSALRAKADSELNSTQYGHARWFFGSTSDIPNWAGYTLGFELVSAYIAAQTPGTTAATLVSTSANTFLSAWSVQ